MSPATRKLFGELFSESEQEAPMEEKPEVEKPEVEEKPKVEYPLEVADYFSGFVGPALGAEGEMKPDTFVHMKTFLKGWAKHHYKKHTKHQPKVTMEEFRKTSNKIKHEYAMTDGTKLMLRIKLEYRDSSGYCMNLRSKALSAEGGTQPQEAQLGTLLVVADKVRHTLPKTAWLFMDMIHLIILISAHTKAEKSQIKTWFGEAKAFYGNLFVT